MDEAAWIVHWRDLYASLVLIGPLEQRHRGTPTESHLERLEEHLRCRLPASYRAFVKILGPGHLAISFTIFAPGYRGAPVIDFLSNNKWQDDVAGRRDEPERVRRLVAFGDFLGNYQPFCWDTGDVRDPSGTEYQIVHVPRATSGHRLVRRIHRRLLLGRRFLAVARV